MFFTTKYRIPKDRRITYSNFICNIHTQKSETHHVRLTAGGDKINYPDDPSSPEVSLLNVKIHINSTISRAKHNAGYICIDIKKFYLGTPMKYFQYMRIHKNRKITYANFICNIRPQKSDTYRVRLTAGGDKLDYPDDPISPSFSLLNVKIHINSTISRAKQNARYMCIDI